MRIQLQPSGQQTCLPLPQQATEHPGFAAGSEVEVIWDAPRSQLVVRAVQAADAGSAGDVSVDISQFVENFILTYQESLRELATL